MLSFSRNEFSEFPVIGVQFFSNKGKFEDGKWTRPDELPLNLYPRYQNATPRDIKNAAPEGRRIVEAKTLRFEEDYGFALADRWVFDGEEWETLHMDLRPARRFFKIIVGRLDK